MPSSTSGFGSFMEGIQGGIQARDQMDMRRQYKRLLKDKADRADWQWDTDVQAARDQYRTEHGTEEGFTAPERAQDRDPALIRFGKWLGGKMGLGGAPMVNEETGATESAALTPATIIDPKPQEAPQTFGVPEQQPQYARDGGMIRRYQDGGAVEWDEHELYALEHAGGDRQRRVMERDLLRGREARAAANRDPETAGGFGPDLMRDIGRGVTEGAFDDTVNTWRGADDAMAERRRQWSEAEGAAEHGAAARDWLIEGGRGTLGLGAALAKDVIIDNPVTQAVGGFFGFDGGGDDEQGAGIPTPETTQGAAAETPTGADEQAATNATAPDPVRSNEQIAETAMTEGEAKALENLDYRRLVDAGMRPNDLPQMSTQEWADYRSNIFEREIAYGRGTQEAYQAVDDIVTGFQMNGFQREAQKAFLYMQTGQMDEAGMALSMAYQYFPNGARMEIASMDDPASGRPVLVARAYDEQTGEPSGSPVVVTADRLNAMVENFSNPQAFRAWTKDHQDLQLSIAQLESLDEYRQGSLDIDAYNAETRRAEAITDARSGTGGMTASERRQRDEAYYTRMQEAGLMEDNFEDPEVMRGLSSAMTIYELLTGKDINSVTNEVMDAYSSGGEEGVAALLDALRQGE